MTKLLSPLDQAIRKAYWRLLPMLMISYVAAYVDRNNVLLAKMKMVNDLPSFRDRTETIFGFGQVAFFIGFLLLEIPGAIIVETWSARKFICYIMITWGILGSLTAFVTQPWHFHLIRFLLGLAQAGFFPGVIVYLTHWFPEKARAQALSLFLIGVPIAQLVSPKISYYLLRMGTSENNIYHPTLFALHGWQWMYIVWGVPSVLLGIVIFFFLTDRPKEAQWLTKDQCQAVESELIIEQTRRQAAEGYSTNLIEGLFDIKVLLLSAVYFLIGTTDYGVDSFLPTILRNRYHSSDALLSWIFMIPPLVVTLSILLVGWSSDRLKERRLHTAVPIVLGAVSLALISIRSQPIATMICLFTTINIGVRACNPAFWSLPNLFLSETAAAGSIGFINSIGNLGNGAGPTLMGFLKAKTSSVLYPMIFLTICMSLAAFITLSLPVHDKFVKDREQIPGDTQEELLESDMTKQT